jgi:TRAP-type uncharacterized transport system substrate-binding protein
VEFETTGSDGISVRIAEDLARLVDDGATRRVVPVVGKSSLQNITDLRYLRGIDTAIVQADVLDYAKQQVFPGLENSVSFITKLYNEEFHLLARAEINEIGQLTNQTVNADLLGSGTAVTTDRLFDQLKIQANITHDSPQVALDKLRKGQIAAIAFVTGKPAPLFAGLTSEDGLHFISVPFSAASGAIYAPTQLTATDYPKLVPSKGPIDTVAVGSILLAADLRQSPERNNNLANFVQVFFTGFQSLLAAGNHPKWNEVNLAAEMPGWRRYDPAARWLQQNAQVSSIQDPAALKAMFLRFIDERRMASGGEPMSRSDKDALFQQFQSWQTTQSR